MNVATFACAWCTLPHARDKSVKPSGRAECVCSSFGIMDVFSRSLFVRAAALGQRPVRELIKNSSISNVSSSSCRMLIEDVSSGIPEILGINVTVWLVSQLSLSLLKTLPSPLPLSPSLSPSLFLSHSVHRVPVWYALFRHT